MKNNDIILCIANIQNMKIISWELNFLEKLLNKKRLNAEIEQHGENTFTITLEGVNNFLSIGNFNETQNFIKAL